MHTEKQYYVYIHRRNDTGEVFYVGKGSGKRATTKDSHNKWWQHIVKKHGYTVEIIETYNNEQDAYNMETYLIQSYKALGVEIVNLTDGGGGPRSLS